MRESFLPYPRRKLPVHIFWNVSLLLIKELQIWVIPTGLRVTQLDILRISGWGSEHPFSPRQEKGWNLGLQKVLVVIEPWYKNWTCRFTSSWNNLRNQQQRLHKLWMRELRKDLLICWQDLNKNNNPYKHREKENISETNNTFPLLKWQTNVFIAE